MTSYLVTGSRECDAKVIWQCHGLVTWSAPFGYLDWHGVFDDDELDSPDRPPELVISYLSWLDTERFDTAVFHPSEKKLGEWEGWDSAGKSRCWASGRGLP